MKNYQIDRSEECHSDYVDFADEYLIKALVVYKPFWFLSKKKRLCLIKEHAIKQLMDIQHNLCNSNWVCLSKSEKKIGVVRGFMQGSIDSISCVTSINKLKT